MDQLRDMEDRIRCRAFEIFSENGLLGRDLDNWLIAEEEVTCKPSLELREKDNHFILEIAIPGVDPKAIDIEVTPEHILMKAEQRHQHDEKQGDVHVCEFKSGNLFRAIGLPKKINPEKVKAEFKNGMLVLTAEIAEEARAKKVAVQAA
jgi:HSP20 family molecular chaperone IbpA